MKSIANLLFEARKLKELPRSGYAFLGAGNETVAEHSFMTTFIAFVMARMETDINEQRLTSMCLVHDLPEARTGDLNYVQKEYVTANEEKAVKDLSSTLPFGHLFADLIDEFNQGETKEARLANDADQLSFILELKALADIGYDPPKAWLTAVISRLKTDTGKKLSETIMDTQWDEWWRKNIIDRDNGNQ